MNAKQFAIKHYNSSWKSILYGFSIGTIISYIISKPSSTTIIIWCITYIIMQFILFITPYIYYKVNYEMPKK